MKFTRDPKTGLLIPRRGISGLDRVSLHWFSSSILGYDTKGGSDASPIDTNYAWHDITDEIGGITDLLHVYCYNFSGLSKSVKLAIYTDAGNNQPGNQLAEEITVTVPHETDGEVSGAYVVNLAASTKYWIACIVEDGDVDVYYNSADANRQAYSASGQGYDLKDPFPYLGNYSNRFSVWATYAPVGGGSIVPLIEQQMRRRRI